MTETTADAQGNPGVAILQGPGSIRAAWLAMGGTGTLTVTTEWLQTFTDADA